MDVAIDLTDVVIETERLVLRGWRDDDLADFNAYASVDGWGKWPAGATTSLQMNRTGLLDSFMTEKDVLALEHKRTAK
jgi:ribosomal-protein-alanine N-acetyltransferase